MIMLAIVFAGTAGSFIYGRAALAREEHFKAVAYLLRGKMEEVQSVMQMVDAARDPYSPRSQMGAFTYPPYTIEDYRLRREKPISVTIQRRAIRQEDLPETGIGTVDYYVLTMDATWRERDLPEDGGGGPGKLDTLTFVTAFVARGNL
jgi:hypothetical protein